MLTKLFPVKYLKRLLLVIAALMITAISLALHRGTLDAGIPIDYAEDPYSIMATDACR